MTENILLVDIGNTAVTVALGKSGRVRNVSSIKTASSSSKAVNAVASKTCGGKPVAGVIISSVVPSVGRLWRDQLKKIYGVRPLMLSHKLDIGVNIDYPEPASIGADRLANACAAVDIHGTPVIVADFGTALTFDVISRDRSYIGGVVAPGLPLMTDYLAEKTALLPRVELKGQCGNVGRSTVGAMRIGAKIGYRGMVREIVEHLKMDPRMKRAKLCATGGYAKWALEGIGIKIDFDPNLTLHGLNVIYGLNKS